MSLAQLGWLRLDMRYSENAPCRSCKPLSGHDEEYDLSYP